VSKIVVDGVKAGRAEGGGRPPDILFRAIFLFALFSSLAISAYHRKRARDTAGTIPRRAEGTVALLLRAAAGLTLFGTFLLYPVSPRRLAWSTLALPRWLRWIAASVAIACLPLLQWMFVNVGANISETVLTKSSHRLVTQGPYRWIRHPLYAFSLLEFLSLALLAGNWFMIGFVGVVIAAFRFVVIPREEANLVSAFGESYEVYRSRTGALFPRLRH
jgi:protein-S-isoprenylcysteine O-methyltransferase Ste14